MKKILGIFVIVLLLSQPALSQKYKIKFASLAPRGSTWLNVMEEFDAAVREQTNGQVGFKMYPGGIMGDDKNVLRKIRLGQLHSAGFTGVGMGEILPEVRILDTPFLFQNSAEVDFITEKFNQRFADAFAAKNFILLGWAEVGQVYVFSETPIRARDDIKRVKMWMWESDPVARATFDALNVKATPLSVIEVSTALQTGMVNGVYASPLAILGLQWFTEMNYMLETPLTNAAGAVLISRKMFEKMPQEYRDVLMKNAKIYFKKLNTLSRIDNNKSIETLKNNGIQTTTAAAADLAELIASGTKARQLLTGDLYSAELLSEVLTALDEYRNTHP